MWFLKEIIKMRNSVHANHYSGAFEGEEDDLLQHEFNLCSQGCGYYNVSPLSIQCCVYAIVFSVL